jgi:hypothetical protein
MKKLASLISLFVACLLFLVAARAWRADSAWLSEQIRQDDLTKAKAAQQEAEQQSDAIASLRDQADLKNDQLRLEDLRTKERIATLEGKRPDYAATARMQAIVRADQLVVEAENSQLELSQILTHPTAQTDVRKTGEVERRRDRRLIVALSGIAFLVGGLALFPTRRRTILGTDRNQNQTNGTRSDRIHPPGSGGTDTLLDQAVTTTNSSLETPQS